MLSFQPSGVEESWMVRACIHIYLIDVTYFYLVCNMTPSDLAVFLQEEENIASADAHELEGKS